MVGGAEEPAALRCVGVARRQPLLEPTSAPRAVVCVEQGIRSIAESRAPSPEASTRHRRPLPTHTPDPRPIPRHLSPPPQPAVALAPRRTKRSSCASLPRAPICDLSKDLLLEILIRLPSLPSLVRAALTCRTFLAAVSSSPAFRRRFRALHPPPLLGFFFEPDDIENPTFMPIRRGSDRDHAAAVRGLDAFLTRLPHQDDLFPGWQIMKCCSGCLLLINWEQLAVYNPLTAALDLIPEVPYEISKGQHLAYDLFLVVPDDEASDRRSFRVFSSCHDESRVRVAVFSSATRTWHILPWSEPVQTPPVIDEPWLAEGEQVTGFLCWSRLETTSYSDQTAYMVLLDTATLRVSVIDMPDGLSEQGHPYSYKTGDTKDGKLCIVATIDFTLSVWFRTPDADGVDKWVLQNELQLKEEVFKATKSPRPRDEFNRLEVLAIRDGIVYMTPCVTDNNVEFCWYLSFCLETRKLDKLIYVKAAKSHPYDTFHPYIMPWPASLIGSQMGRGEGDDTLGSQISEEMEASV